MQAQIIIIGAGMAGLMAGRTLQDAGHDVWIVDKGRRVGGRMSSRREAGFLFNHGAQFVTARSPLFSALCTQALQENILDFWPDTGRENAYSGTPAMRDLASFIAAGLKISQEVEIASIKAQAQGGFHLHTAAGTEYQAQHILVTAPAPQTAKLLEITAPNLAMLANQVEYAPCWTVMGGMNNPCDSMIPVLREAGIIGWASLEASRPNAGQMGAVTIQANPDYSKEHLEDPAERIISDCFAEFERHQNAPPITWIYQRAHRWRYAKVERPVTPDSAYIESHKEGLVAVAGDWHPVATAGTATGARAEEALLSGHRAATSLMEQLK